MSLFQNPLLEVADFISLNEDLKKSGGPFLLSDAADTSKSHIISELGDKPYKLVVTYDENHAGRLYDDIACFLDNVYLYTAKDILFFSADISSDAISKERIEVWKHMSEDDSYTIVTTIDALMDKLEDLESFRSNIISVKDTDSINLSELSLKLAKMGYERVSEISGFGQFAVRGGIIDIFPVTQNYPVRIELWDDEVDSMRYFDPYSQRSMENDSGQAEIIKEIKIYPAREEELAGTYSFLRYFDLENTVIFIDELQRVKERAETVEQEYQLGVAGRIESGQFKREEIPDLIPANEILSDLVTKHTVYLSAISHRVKEVDIKRSYAIETRQTIFYHEAFENLVSDLKKYKKENYRVVLTSASRTRAMRLAGSLRDDYGLPAFYTEDADVKVQRGQIVLLNGNVHSGFEYPGVKFVLLSESDIFGKRIKQKRKKKKYEGNRLSAITELSIGDYVVHEDHGVGKYLGLEKIEREGIVKDYIKLEYQGGDNCFVPVSKFDRLQRFAANEAKAPKLNKLGGDQWNKTKSRVKKAVDNMAKELVELYASRLKGKGVVYGPDTVWQREFEELFQFEETGDQLKAIEDAKKDMENGKIMDRLICGDVGYGKTEIALRVAFKAIEEGYQVLYLVPTTILATQHYNNFIQRLKDFPIRADLLCRFNTKKEQDKTLADLKRGTVDIVVGTHRLLSKDVTPKKLGLVIVDEEQRFGVAHKEKLKKLCENVNVLTLTATPIPRTLHMSLAGIRDLNVLEEAPMDRKPVQTYVMEYHDETIKEAIRREIARGGQVYYLYNRVNNISEVAAHVQELLPEAGVAYVHGRMPERELEDKMLDFINGETDVLVTTTIIETGLDVPNANTIIIHDSERLGLSQLYQLRGRVGRSSRRAYAFLLYKRNKLLGEEAEKRLKAIREFSELGSGIKIAMRDLEIRGAGNVLGSEQHGHMQAVGYDLYVKLLNTAIKALKGEDSTSDIDTGVELDMNAYIPDSYISNEETKLEIYKRISLIENESEYFDMQDELVDRFGDMTEEVNNLLLVARIKSMAKKLFITDVIINKLQIRFIMRSDAKIRTENIDEFIKTYSGNLTIKPGEAVRWEYREKGVLENRLELAVTILENMRKMLV